VLRRSYLEGRGRAGDVNWLGYEILKVVLLVAVYLPLRRFAVPMPNPLTRQLWPIVGTVLVCSYLVPFVWAAT
jgi:hypothetical protein